MRRDFYWIGKKILEKSAYHKMVTVLNLYIISKRKFIVMLINIIGYQKLLIKFSGFTFKIQ